MTVSFKLSSQLTSRLPFNPGAVKSEVHTPITYTGGVETTILDASGGPGVVDDIRISTASGDTILRVYVDGESTPSIEFDLAAMLARNIAVAGPYGTQYHNTTFSGSSKICYNWHFPIPFQDTCVITLEPPSATTPLISTTIHYSLGIDLPYKLVTQCQTYADRQTYSKSDRDTKQVCFFELGASNEGFLAFLCLTVDNSSSGDMKWMENAICAFLDGESTTNPAKPSWDAGGAEEFFQISSFYYNANAPTNFNWAATSVAKATGEFTGMIDFLAGRGGIRFDDGVLLCMDSKDHNGNTPETGADIDAAWVAGAYLKL
jgi:hypothetical protein